MSEFYFLKEPCYIHRTHKECIAEDAKIGAWNVQILKAKYLEMKKQIADLRAQNGDLQSRLNKYDYNSASDYDYDSTV